MNQALRTNLGTDTIVRSWPAVAAVSPATFLGSFPSERLKAFKTRFAPSTESSTLKVRNYGLTAGIYAAIAAAAVGLGTLNVGSLFHAF